MARPPRLEPARAMTFPVLRRRALAGAFAFVAVLFFSIVSVAGDTIYQTGAEGRLNMVQRDAIVTHQDSDIIVYKHFDLPDHRVETVRLNQGSLPYSVVPATSEGRQRIVSLWKQFGYTATVTDLAGKSTQIFDAYIDYYPPAGRGSLLEAIPAVTMFPLQLKNGGADIVDFSKIVRIEFDRSQIRLTSRSGASEEGSYLMPTTQPAEARFLGITSHYDPESPDVFDFSIPISRIKMIKFE
jgi:hypothetical protein